jgi:hypothetical protein
MAMGFRTAGSAAKTDTWNPGGSFMPAAASSAGISGVVMFFSLSWTAGKSPALSTAEIASSSKQE